MLNLYSQMVVNISMLVLLATIITKLPIVKSLILREDDSLSITDRLLLGILFGLFSIFATCIGIRINGAIENSRVLGVLAAGLLGGPITGTTAALIAAVHRFLYEPGGLTSFACTVSTLFEGAVGSILWVHFHKRKLAYTPFSLFVITALVECCQMGIILLLARPFEQALQLVRMICVPMVLCNALGMILFYGVFSEVSRSQDLIAADKIRKALNIADECMPFLQKSFITDEDYDAMAHIIEKYDSDTDAMFFQPDGVTELSKAVIEVKADLFSDHVTFFENKEGCVYCAPLWNGKEPWAYLALRTRQSRTSNKLDMDFIRELAKFFSANYELAQSERQKKLLQKAELKALQLQINPHFLFNALNTIAYFCREKPEKARELILTLSVYFRKTLSSTDAYMIPLSEEIEYAKAYTELEQARFEDRLEVVWQPMDYAIEVPSMILQPIVENAIRHGAMKRAHGLVKVYGDIDGNNVSLYVEDNGFGLSEQQLENFRLRRNNGRYGLLNVDERLRSIYGESYGLNIHTGNKGTCIEMRFPLEKEKSDENSVD